MSPTATADTPVGRFLSRWAEAEQAGDPAAIGPLLTDDFVGIGPLGFALPKPAWVGRHASGELRYERFSIEDVAVRDHGDTALVTATHTARGDFSGTPLPEALRASLALVREPDGGDAGEDGWRLAGLHLSFIAGTPGAPPIPGT
jgi:ketosteroid isomerase-like protein